MENFNAHQARQITDGKNNETFQKEIKSVLNTIKSSAENGKSTCTIYEPLQKSTITDLQSRGFSIEHACSMAIQKDSVYYYIKW
jgi:hypothetical protein